ncbi:hypothetical protein MTO96_048894 [Rhipicephalus appendiculatus]
MGIEPTYLYAHSLLSGASLRRRSKVRPTPGTVNGQIGSPFGAYEVPIQLEYSLKQSQKLYTTPKKP